MNPRKLWDFLRSKFGLFVVFLAVLFTGLWLYGRHQAEKRSSARLTTGAKKVELGQVRLPLEKGLENGLPQQASGPSGNAEVSTDGKLVPFRPPAMPAPAPTALPTAPKPDREERNAPVRPKKLHYRTLLASYSPPPVAPPGPSAPPEQFMPFGTLLKCKLVNTVDSANIETPVIAVLLEDVWQNGQRVIPANTLVHGTAKAGRIREGGQRPTW